MRESLLGRTRLVNRVVITSDRRVAAWGALRAWGLGFRKGLERYLPRRALNRSPAQIACGDAVVDQPLQEPERCGSPFLFDRVKKLESIGLLDVKAALAGQGSPSGVSYHGQAGTSQERAC